MLRLKKRPIAAAVLSLIYCAGAYAEDVATDAAQAVTVFGTRQTRQVSEVGKSDIADTAPGSSPLKAISRLPGVNFNSADTYGGYEWGSRISIRGFSQNQLGFTLDDVPLGDMSYRNYNGLHISRAISSENIARAVVSQGTGALGTASTSNLGGTLQFYSLDPSDKAGVNLQQSFGQDSAKRSFVRLDTGLIAGSNTKLSLSFTDQDSDKWRGDGAQKQQQFNSKLVSNFENAKFSAFLNWSDRKEVDYMDQSKDSIRRLGYNWDYYAPNWNTAINSAKHQWASGETSEDDAYYNGSGLREDWLAGATLDYFLTDHASIKTTVYHHNQEGTGTWWLPNPPVVNGTPVLPIALRTLEFNINRSGILSALTIESGIHTFNTGIWYERNDFDNAMRFYAQDSGPSSPYERPSDPYLTRWDYNFQTDTIQFHAQDTLKLSDQLTVNFGFKTPRSTTSIKSYNDTAASFRLNGSLTATKNFLPQAGINFKLNEHNELFADAAQNITAYRGVIKGGASPFDTTQAGFDAVKQTIRPEESITTEAGWRYHDRELESSVTVYHVDFKNRLLALQQGAAIIGNPSILSNVGKVETNGIQGYFAWSPLSRLKWSNSLSYNDSKYKDDFTDNGVIYHSSGKQVVDAPRWIGSSELTYDNGQAFGHVGVNYIGKRYYTYVNDNSVQGYSLWDLGGGYRWKNVGYANELNLSFTVNNVLNKKFFVFGDNPFPSSDAAGTSYNLLAGAPRTAFLTLGAKFK
ncbi:TonB-dependent receptor [Aquirhabdus parva]|nr:TonB-dependent receptor [Aquirhabdus parva]